MPVFKPSAETYGIHPWNKKSRPVFPTGDEMRAGEYGKIEIPDIKKYFRKHATKPPEMAKKAGYAMGPYRDMPEGIRISLDTESQAFELLYGDSRRIVPITIMEPKEYMSKFKSRDPGMIELGHEDWNSVTIAGENHDALSHEMAAIMLRKLMPDFDHEKHHDVVYAVGDEIAKLYRREAMN